MGSLDQKIQKQMFKGVDRKWPLTEAETAATLVRFASMSKRQERNATSASALPTADVKTDGTAFGTFTFSAWTEFLFFEKDGN